jgi:hypothetical protein
MNKDSIYQIIGYKGEYNAQVKRALRKLLKDNHPDHNGDEEIFKLASIVKKELEDNKVSYKVKKTSVKEVYDDINYDYCEEMLLKLTKKRKEYISNLIKEKHIISDLEKEYNNLYHESLKKEKNVLNFEQYKKKFNQIKVKCIILVIILIITFSYAIIKNNTISLIIFFVIALLLFYEVKDYLTTLEDVKRRLKSHMKSYFIVSKDVHEINEIMQNKEDEIRKIERDLKKVENDIRFYNNIIKHK